MGLKMTFLFYLSIKISVVDNLSSTNTEKDFKTGENHNGAISRRSILNFIFSQMNLDGNGDMKCLTLISSSIADPIAEGKISND